MKKRQRLLILKFLKRECVFLCLNQKGQKIKVDLIEDKTLEKQIDITTKDKCKKLERRTVSVRSLNIDKESCTHVLLARQLSFKMMED